MFIILLHGNLGIAGIAKNPIFGVAAIKKMGFQVYEVRDGKWDGHECVITHETQQGYMVLITDVKLSNYDRLHFTKGRNPDSSNVVGSASNVHPYVFVRSVRKVNKCLQTDPWDTKNTRRLLAKWWGKTKSYVKNHIQF